MLVLASSSVSRKQLLERLRVPFAAVSPGVDETSLPGEQPVNLVRRLARLKVRAVVERFPEAVIVGSDQVAVLDEDIVSSDFRIIYENDACAVTYERMAGALSGHVSIVQLWRDNKIYHMEVSVIEDRK